MRRTKHVVVMGATSYVGSYLVPVLGASGYRVTAVGRSEATARVLIPSAPWLQFRTVDQMRHVSTRADAVVNLAYVKRAAPHMARRATTNLVRTVNELVQVVSAARLIHVSTIAVFGNPPSNIGPYLPRGWGTDQYSEGKIQAERTLVRASRTKRFPLAIVRLGNVIGPASPLWVAGLAQRLIAGLPIGWTPVLGPANATYVRNVADYILTLLEASDRTISEFGPFHHLTEFAEQSWDDLVSAIERVTGVDRVLVPEDAPRDWGVTLVRHLRSIARGSSSGALRFLGQWLPLSPSGADRFTESIKALDSPWNHLQQTPVQPGDRGLYDVLSRSIRIPQHTLDGWNAPVDFDRALDEIWAWLRKSGFALLGG